MKRVVVLDSDIIDVNINVAKEYVLKARWTNSAERKAKALVLARSAIDKSLQSLGYDVYDVTKESARQPRPVDEPQKQKDNLFN